MQTKDGTEASRRKSRKKIVGGDYYPKTRQGPNTKNPLPIAVIHPARKPCDHEIVVPLVDQLKQMTGGYVECIDIGDGFLTSIMMPIPKQAKEACASLK